MEPDNTTIERLIAEHIAVAESVRSASEPILAVANAFIDLIARDGKLLICGNGGSAADAGHWSAEWRVRFKKDRRALRAESLVADTMTITAAGNDLGFETIFSRQVEAAGNKGDILLAISTSGSSPNILAAARTAKQQGMQVIAFTGGTGGELAKLADLSFIAPSPVTARIQEMHELAMHIICELIDKHLGVV